MEIFSDAVFQMEESEFNTNIGYLNGFSDYITEEDDINDFNLSDNFITLLKIVKYLVKKGKELDEELRSNISEKDYQLQKTKAMELLLHEMRETFEKFNSFIGLCLGVLAKIYLTFEHGRNIDIEEDLGGKIHEIYVTFLPCIKAFFLLYSFLYPQKNTESLTHHNEQQADAFSQEVYQVSIEKPFDLSLKREGSMMLQRNIISYEDHNEPPQKKSIEMEKNLKLLTSKINTFQDNFELIGEIFSWVFHYYLKLDDGKNNKYFEVLMMDPKLAKTVDLNIRMSLVK